MESAYEERFIHNKKTGALVAEIFRSLSHFSCAAAVLEIECVF